MATNIIDTEHNTLPVLYNINQSTVIYPQYQQYIYIIINSIYILYCYIYTYFSNMKPYDRCKMKTIQGLPQKFVWLPLQLKLLAAFIHKSGRDNISKQGNRIQTVQADTVSLRQEYTDTDILCINFLFFASLLSQSCTKQSGQSCTLYCLGTLLFCVQDINTIKNAVKCTRQIVGTQKQVFS